MIPHIIGITIGEIKTCCRRSTFPNPLPNLNNARLLMIHATETEIVGIPVAHKHGIQTSLNHFDGKDTID